MIQGFDPDIIEAALAHVGKNEVRNAYNRATYLGSEYIEAAAVDGITFRGTKGLVAAS